MTHSFPSGEGLKAQYVMSAMRGLSIKAKHNGNKTEIDR